MLMGVYWLLPPTMERRTTFLFLLAIVWNLAVLLPSAYPQTISILADSNRSASQPQLERIRIEHQHILGQLNAKDSNGNVLSLDDPRVPALLKKGWGLAGEWAALYLEDNPSPTKHELDHIFDGFAPSPRGVKSEFGNFVEYHDYNFNGTALRIGNSAYVAYANYFTDTSTGSFMVLARNQGGHFQVLWNIKDVAEKHYAQRDEIGRWMHLVSRSYYNGPLEVDKVLALPPTANGHARFLVLANQSADGGTILSQLSIWEWDGTQANPLLVDLYEFAADNFNFHIDDMTLRIGTKERTQTLDSCGECAIPRGVWTIRVTPDGVQDLGHRFLTPEIHWADQLLTKIGNDEDVTESASPDVVEALMSHIKETEAEDAKLGLAAPKHFNWGLLEKCRVLSRGQQGGFELSLDGAKMRFSYKLRNGKPYFRHLRIR